MKYLKKYNESTDTSIPTNVLDDIGVDIEHILCDISDNELYVSFRHINSDEKSKKYRTDRHDNRYYITISTYDSTDSDNEHRYREGRIEWSEIKDTIERIDTYLKEYGYYVYYDIYVSGVSMMVKNDNKIKYLSDTNPSAIDFEINIELYTQDEWKKLMS